MKALVQLGRNAWRCVQLGANHFRVGLQDAVRDTEHLFRLALVFVALVVFVAAPLLDRQRDVRAVAGAAVEVSGGIATVLLVYAGYCAWNGIPRQMRCLDAMARYLFFAFLIDSSLEMLDLVHRIYEADESFKTLDFMVHTRLYGSQIVLQIVLGTLLPIGLLAITQLVSLSERARQGIYAISAVLTLCGIFAMPWNVVIGGQLFSKSFLGYTTYKMGFATREGLLPALLLLLLPLAILWVLVTLLPPMSREEPAS